MPDPLALAEQLLDDARGGVAGGPAGKSLAEIDPTLLADALADDASRTTFWLNVYNASVRSRITAAPASYGQRWRFFNSPVIQIAGRLLSPNAIEHGLLRRSAWIFGFGYLRNPFPPGFERRLRMDRLDPRIHFALNCGARSCPPLAAWERARLDTGLEAATAAYLAAETRLDHDADVIYVPRLMLWYIGDFGGPAGVRSLLRRHGILGPEARPRLRFGVFDWTLDTDSAR